jgi:Zn-dependent protease
MDINTIVHGISVWLLPALIAITFHEASHGFVALRFGDDTALRAGRVTFNPFKHIDPFGTILLPGLLLLMRSPFLFGYAKPVPVNFGRLRNPRRDMVWVAAAGPGINLALAFVSALLVHIVPLLPEAAGKWAIENLSNSIQINVVLAVFNMLPIPPLDGGRVAVGLLPNALAFPLARLERWGMFIILGGMFILPLIGGQLGLDLNIFSWLVGIPVDYLIGLILKVTGLL